MSESKWFNWKAREKIYHLKCKEPFGQAVFDSLWMLYKAKPIVRTNEIIQAVDGVVQDWNGQQKGTVKKQVPK